VHPYGRRTTLLVGALLLTACGTTVPVTSRVQASGDLGGPAAGQDPALSQGTASSSTPGAAGTGTGSTGTSGSVATGTGATGAGLPTVRATTAGARVTAPLSIGVVLTATSNAQQFGVSLGNTYSERQVDDAIINGLNAQGGLAGRKIVAVYAQTDTGSSNWETDFSAACATFTQDHHVVAVLGYVFNYFSSFERCLAAKRIPHLSTGFNVPDREELSKFPLQVDLDVPTIDRRGLLKLVGATSDGVLTPKNKIGLLTDTCPGTPTSLQHVFLPAAKKLGLHVEKTVAINCPNGNADSGAAASALQSAVLQFAAAGVDRVLFHASSEGPALLLFSLSAESQGYHPSYVVSSLANLEAVRGYLPPGQLGNIHGYGWMPTQDIPPRFYPRANSLQQRCLALLRSGSVTPSSGPDFYYGYNFCEALFAYERALLITQGDSDGRGVIAAVKSLGTSFASLTNDGGSAFSPDLPDAPRSMRHLVYTASCSCFRYTGPTRAIPTSV
jgi:hypothetical protein